MLDNEKGFELLSKQTTTRDKLRAALWMAIYGSAFTLGLLVSGVVLVLLFDFLPKVARLFTSTYIGG